MSELPAGLQPAKEATPRLSGSVVVLRSREGRRELLLGVRSRRSRFMPGHWAFPGGVMDPEDEPQREGAFARCAVRELEEETGIALAAERLTPIGERTTPPIYPVRFHTAFFLAEVDGATPDPQPPTEEIEQLLFVRAEEVLRRWEAGECAVPPPVLPLLRTLAEEIDLPWEQLVASLSATNEQEQTTPRIEFVPDVWMLPQRTATMPPATHTNVWMPGGERFVVIDPGSTESAERDRLAATIERKQRSGSSLCGVLLTHRHQDHISGVADLCQRFSQPLYAHPKLLEHPAVASVADRRPLADGEDLDLGGLILRAHWTPGHDPTHIAYEGLERGWLIAGDLISGISTILIEPLTGNMGHYLDSLERMHALGFRKLLPGHGPPIPAKAFAKLLEHRRSREARVLAAVGERGELAAIARGAYDDQPELPQRLIELQTRAHLQHLEEQGKIIAIETAVWKPKGES